jgi:hypothetical protein
MSKRLSVVLMFAVLLAGCSPVVAPTPTLTPIPTLAPTLTPVPTLTWTPTPAYPDLAISMAGACRWGLTCVYRVTVDAEGNVDYQQSGPRGTAQRKVAEITPEQIDELVKAINKSNVWTMQDEEYQCCDLVPLTVSVTLNGRSKQVSRYDAAGDCRVAAPDETPKPGEALCELRYTIALITNLDQWDKQWPTPAPPSTNTPILSRAKVVVTAFIDANGDGTPEPGERLNNVPVQLRLPDGKILSATTQQGVATFDMSGYPAGIQVTVSLPNLYRSYQFFLPQRGTVPVVFSFVQPTVPGKSP